MLDSVSESEHAALVERAIGGDRAALQELLVLHCEPVQRWIAGRLPLRLQRTLDAEDILQQALHHAAQKIGGLQGRSSSAVRGWLQSIAQHSLQDAVEAHDCRKREGRWTRRGEAERSDSAVQAFVDVLTAHAPTPSGALAEQEAIHAIQAGLAVLPEEQRRAVLTRYFEGKSLAETATAMRRSPGAVRGLVDRAKLSLRSALGRSSRWFLKK